MSETLYDHPLYYDILFGWDRSAEAAFYASVFQRAGAGRAILEVACGTGQVARRLAARGWSLTGLDSSRPMLDFFARAAAETGSSVDTICAPMEAFRAAQRFDAAFNPMSSLRLLDVDAVTDHLSALRTALRPEAPYVVDLTFSHGEDEAEEEWVMTRDGVTVTGGTDSVTVVGGGETRILPWAVGEHVRPWTSDDFEELVARHGGFAIDSWHPESGRVGADGASGFELAVETQPPVVGRAMVVLRRLSG